MKMFSALLSLGDHDIIKGLGLGMQETLLLCGAWVSGGLWVKLR